MTLKNVFTIIIFSFFITSCSTNQLAKNDVIKAEEKSFFIKNELERDAISDTLLSDINYILFLLKKDDLITLNNRFINKQYGLYEVFKNNEDKKIYFDRKLEIDEISSNIDSLEIKQEEAIFDCSPNNDANYGWNKEGVFISANIKTYLTDTMKEANLIVANSYSSEDLKIADFIEKKSYELVVPYNMVFYITKIDKQWYITLIDKVKTDCSE